MGEPFDLEAMARQPRGNQLRELLAPRIVIAGIVIEQGRVAEYQVSMHTSGVQDGIAALHRGDPIAVPG